MTRHPRNDLRAAIPSRPDAADGNRPDPGATTSRRPIDSRCGWRAVPCGEAARLFAGVFLAKGLDFALYLLLARSLGVEQYGRYTFALSYTLLFSTLGDLGLSTVFTREVARDPQRARELLAPSMAIKLVLALICLASVFAMARWPVPAAAQASLVTPIVLGMLLVSLALLFDGLLRAAGRAGAAGVVTAVQSLTALVAGRRSSATGWDRVPARWQYLAGRVSGSAARRGRRAISGGEAAATAALERACHARAGGAPDRALGHVRGDLLPHRLGDLARAAGRARGGSLRGHLPHLRGVRAARGDVPLRAVPGDGTHCRRPARGARRAVPALDPPPPPGHARHRGVLHVRGGADRASDARRRLCARGAGSGHPGMGAPGLVHGGHADVPARSAPPPVARHLGGGRDRGVQRGAQSHAGAALLLPRRLGGHRGQRMDVLRGAAGHVPARRAGAGLASLAWRPAAASAVLALGWWRLASTPPAGAVGLMLAGLATAATYGALLTLMGALTRRDLDRALERVPGWRTARPRPS